MSACVQISKKRKVTVIEKIVIVLQEDKEKYIVLTFIKRL